MYKEFIQEDANAFGYMPNQEVMQKCDEVEFMNQPELKDNRLGMDEAQRETIRKMERHVSKTKY